MKKITVRTKAAKKLRAGYPLLVAEDLNSPLLEDDFAQFFDEKGQALGTGYLSKQNKGVGWLLDSSSIHPDRSSHVKRVH
ncbi:hypothetical protein ACI3PH_09425 [Lactococcus lactis]